ncbi:MAG: AarF/UbiB family protein [Acidobacteriota bacterium]
MIAALISSRRFGRIGKTYRHAQRYRQILRALIKYGHADLVEGLKLDQLLGAPLKLVPGTAEMLSLSRAQRIRLVLEELGPTFIKAGQLLSTRPDLLPADLIQELAGLRNDVPPISAEQVVERVEGALKRPLGDLFASFDEEPLAAASIAQVHGARLEDGREVVVKVQRPELERLIAVDLEILSHLAHLLEERFDGWAVQRPTQVVEELGVLLEEELDFRLEASAQVRFAGSMKGVPGVRVPRVERQLTRAEVLIMERVQGLSMAHPEALREAGLHPSALASRLARLTMRQVFRTGHFHGDPHPGNLLVEADGSIVYLDFGLTGQLERDRREALADLLIGVVQHDGERLTDAWLALTSQEEITAAGARGGSRGDSRSDSKGRDRELDPEERRRKLRRALELFSERHFFQPLGELSLGDLLQELLEIANRHHLSVPADLFVVIKALANVEGVCRNLDPDFEIAPHAAPYLRRIQLERLDPRRLAADASEIGSEALDSVAKVPRELGDTLGAVRRGKVRLGFDLGGLEPLNQTLDRVSNRLAFAIVLASLVIGSSLVVRAALPPLWHGLPVIGLAGFVVAGLMGFWLLVSILKHGRM